MKDDWKTRFEAADPVHRLRRLLDARTLARQNLDVLGARMQRHASRVPPALQEAYDKSKVEFSLADANLRSFLTRHRSPERPR